MKHVFTMMMIFASLSAQAFEGDRKLCGHLSMHRDRFSMVGPDSRNVYPVIINDMGLENRIEAGTHRALSEIAELTKELSNAPRIRVCAVGVFWDAPSTGRTFVFDSISRN